MSAQARDHARKKLLEVLEMLAVIDLLWWTGEMLYVAINLGMTGWQRWGGKGNSTIRGNSSNTAYPAPTLIMSHFGFSRSVNPDTDLAWIGALVVYFFYFFVSIFLARRSGALYRALLETNPGEIFQRTNEWMCFTLVYWVSDFWMLLEPVTSSRPFALSWLIFVLHGIAILVASLVVHVHRPPPKKAVVVAAAGKGKQDQPLPREEIV